MRIKSKPLKSGAPRMYYDSSGGALNIDRPAIITAFPVVRHQRERLVLALAIFLQVRERSFHLLEFIGKTSQFGLGHFLLARRLPLGTLAVDQLLVHERELRFLGFNFLP